MKKTLLLLPIIFLLNLLNAAAQENEVVNQIVDGFDFQELGIRLIINIVSVYILVHLVYYTRHKNKDFQFTLILFNCVNFLICYLLSGANLEVGFAFGLFAIFSIMRYRTVTVPIKEMGYLFISLAMGLINSLAKINDNYILLIGANLFILILPVLMDRDRTITKTKGQKNNEINSSAVLNNNPYEKTQDINYERIDLIKPERRDEMIEDLRERTGLSIHKVEIVSIDLMQDVALIKAHYLDIINKNSIQISTNHI